jgi:hypothetical protein
VITGYYLTSRETVESFSRSSSGTFTTFEAPGASSGVAEGTLALAINTGGSITGYYLTSGIVFEGFLRTP